MAAGRGYGRGAYGYARTPVRAYAGRKAGRIARKRLPKSVGKNERHLVSKLAAYSARRAVDQVTARGKWAKAAYVLRAIKAGEDVSTIKNDPVTRSVFPEVRALYAAHTLVKRAFARKH